MKKSLTSTLEEMTDTEWLEEKTLKVAIVHDWLPVYAGAERVLEQMISVFPQADVFTLVDFLAPEERGFLQGCSVKTSFIQRLPFSRRKYRNYVALAPLAVEQFDLSAYDLILSSSYLVAKAALTNARQMHISYVHSPVRYAWDLQFQYLKELGFEKGIRGFIFKMVLHYLRIYDVTTAHRVDHFLANSGYVKNRIQKIYSREAVVIHPPVSVDQFTPVADRGDHFITVSRLVPYKKIHLIVEAFTRMPDKKLIVVGDGPDMARIRKAAGDNVNIMGHIEQAEMNRLIGSAQAFVFAAEEDFGIAPVEALASGTPVIAYGRGGVLESVQEGLSGVFFDEQSPESIQDAVMKFLIEGVAWDSENIRESSLKFAPHVFKSQLRAFVRARLSDSQERNL